MLTGKLDGADVDRVRGGEVKIISLASGEELRFWASRGGVYLTKGVKDDTLNSGLAQGEGAAAPPPL